ncbi:glycosyltransferase [Spirosoma sp. BT702]|uniref:Glycosyltransferase n=1 Tax=Spirosoma profusum TaxID=2771354 RepID=A0A926Y254_9BACT|nr:glycosyltransferase [Spirosoma profusum]MBD2700685.1 glycosyltransferase [Spirosoma profusum]
MTILNLSALDYGGAGKFAVDFNDFLRQSGYESNLVVMDKKTDSPNVVQYVGSRLSKPFSKLARKAAKSKWEYVTFDYDYYFYNIYERYSTISAKKILEAIPKKPDVIFMHWVTDFINAQLMNELHRLTGAKMYWLMIDNAPITGGCHYPWSCEGYKTDCSTCLAISSPTDQWLARENLKLKIQYLPATLGVMAFSNSDYERARQSRLFNDKPIAKLLGYVNEDKFVPGDKVVAKKFFGLPTDHKVIFFGATSLKERRKGMQFLLNALNALQFDNVTLLVAGNSPVNFEGKNIKLAGHLNEADLIKAYQAADLFVCPSIEDSGPIMVNQSIMCGTPVAAFNTGVAQDLVITGKTGYRAEISDFDDLAKGIHYLIQMNDDCYVKMAQNCRDMAVSLYGRRSFQQQIEQLIVA